MKPNKIVSALCALLFSVDPLPAEGSDRNTLWSAAGQKEADAVWQTEVSAPDGSKFSRARGNAALAAIEGAKGSVSLALGFLALTFGGLGLLESLIRRAPVGYEDRRGFHFSVGEKRERASRQHRRRSPQPRRCGTATA